jgi:hypothetical protein
LKEGRILVNDTKALCGKQINFRPPTLICNPEANRINPRIHSVSLKLGPRAQFGIQESGVAGVQEPENLEFGKDFPKEMPVPDFSDKDLPRLFCNS